MDGIGWRDAGQARVVMKNKSMGCDHRRVLCWLIQSATEERFSARLVLLVTVICDLSVI